MERGGRLSGTLAGLWLEEGDGLQKDNGGKPIDLARNAIINFCVCMYNSVEG